MRQKIVNYFSCNIDSLEIFQIIFDSYFVSTLITLKRWGEKLMNESGNFCQNYIVDNFRIAFSKNLVRSSYSTVPGPVVYLFWKYFFSNLTRFPEKQVQKLFYFQIVHFSRRLVGPPDFRVRRKDVYGRTRRSFRNETQRPSHQGLSRSGRSELQRGSREL